MTNIANWKITMFNGKNTISMVIFHSYVKLPEGIYSGNFGISLVCQWYLHIGEVMLMKVPQHGRFMMDIPSNKNYFLIPKF